MDIVTHAMLGGILASPLMAEHPVLAAGFILGSVLPDLDSLSRVFGKDAFLRCHQTLSHSFFFQFLVLALGWAVDPWYGPGVTGLLATGITAGMLLHVMLDYTNTMGVTLLAPFTWRRYCLEWVFFIDGPVFVVCCLALGFLAWSGLEPGPITTGFAFGLSCYWAIRGWLAQRARQLVPKGTVSLIPSPYLPWVFLGFWRNADRGENFSVDALTGAIQLGESFAILDADYRSHLVDLPEYRAMVGLSPAFHVVAARDVEGGVKLYCRDLRTRPIGRRFGDLAVLFDGDGVVRRVDFRV